jgi:predicted GH43/DUF377 family glycosyl hydrolase
MNPPAVASPGSAIERLNNGHPILEPNGQWWESGVTFNPAAVYLERSEKNDPIIAGLLGDEIPLDDPRVADGVVAVHYRARPLKDPYCSWNRSFIGLAIYTPTLELLRRFEQPVMRPDDDPHAVDHLGVEDPRITRIDDVFYMVYCGVARVPQPRTAPDDRDFATHGFLCLASSRDLIHWERHGTPPGNLQVCHNKDGVLFPEKFAGRFWLLHRPVDADETVKAIQLAWSNSFAGPWVNDGVILSAAPHPRATRTWVGAGSVPIALGAGRYLVLYHTGSWLNDRDREYVIDAAIIDLGRASLAGHDGSIVERRLNRLMVPQTPHELGAPVPDSVGNVLFPCGSYEYRGDIYILYGAADTYVLAAKVNKRWLLDALEAGDAMPSRMSEIDRPAPKIDVSVAAAAAPTASMRA